MIASSMGSPRAASASSLKERRTSAESSSGQEALWAEADLLGGAHQALEGGDAAVRPRQQEVAGGAADDDRAVVVDADRRGRQNLAEGIGDEAGPRLRENGDEGVRGAEIDAADRQEKPRRFARGL